MTHIKVPVNLLEVIAPCLELKNIRGGLIYATAVFCALLQKFEGDSKMISHSGYLKTYICYTV